MATCGFPTATAVGESLPIEPSAEGEQLDLGSYREGDFSWAGIVEDGAPYEISCQLDAGDLPTVSLKMTGPNGAGNATGTTTLSLQATFDEYGSGDGQVTLETPQSGSFTVSGESSCNLRRVTPEGWGEQGVVLAFSCGFAAASMDADSACRLDGVVAIEDCAK